jgi:acyl-CoA thioesterase-1
MMRLRSRASVGSWFLLLALACSGEPAPDNEAPVPGKDTPAPARRTILFVGTSITAGYGLDPDQAWTTRIQSLIDEAGLPFRVVNAGVSGETSAGALRRIEWVLNQDPPQVVMVETGANDGLRGQSVDSLEANLDAILTRLGRLDPRPVILLAGMEAPPNLGATYTNRFRSIYPKLARDHRAVFLPFLLDGVAGNARFNQADGIHPNEEGSMLVADNVWKVLQPILDSIAG